MRHAGTDSYIDRWEILPPRVVRMTLKEGHGFAEIGSSSPPFFVSSLPRPFVSSLPEPVV
jgi:hypothetical protein